MSNLSPEATVLINKYTPGEIAEQVVKLEAALAGAQVFAIELKADLKELTDQYHLAHAKILSREAINEDLGNDIKRLSELIDECDGWSGGLGA